MNLHPKTKTPCSGAASGASGSAAGASGGSDSSMSSSSSMSSNICRARRCSFGDADRGFSRRTSFLSERVAQGCLFFPPFEGWGGKKHMCHVFFAVWQFFRWIWSRLAEEWCRFFLVVSSQVVFVSCSGFESPNTTLKYTLFHQH